MKVIDLLNKIANGEEIEKIKILGMEYYIDDGNFLCDEFGRVKWCIDDEWLNIPVEIIEDKKILEKLESYISCGWNGTCNDLKRADLFDNLEKIGNKINEIIDYLEEKES